LRRELHHTTDTCLYRLHLRHKTSAWASGGPAGGSGEMLGAMARTAPSKPNEAMARIAPHSPMVPQKKTLDPS
jgi:hypothetical protein